MGNIVAQNASTDVVCGPFVNIYGSTIADLAIANNQIVLVKEGSVSVARSDVVSATSVAPGMQRISLNATDTNTLGTLTIWVSASAMMPYAKQIEVWQSGTWNMFYGSADHILGSVGASVLISTLVNRGLTNYDVPTSADISAIVTVVVKNVFTNMDVATSTGISAAISIVASAVAGRALTNYQALTSAAASALISVVVKNALTLGDIATSTGVSALVSIVGSTIANRALVNYDVPTSADVSAIVAAVAPGGGVSSAAISGIVIQALTDYDVPTSSNVSAMVTTAGYRAMTNAISNADLPTSAAIFSFFGLYDVPTSADVSAIVANAVWNQAATEPTTAPDWGSVSRGTGFDWLLARSLNRHSQTSGTIEIYASAGTVIASASVSNNSVSATRDQFRG